MAAGQLSLRGAERRGNPDDQGHQARDCRVAYAPRNDSFIQGSAAGWCEHVPLGPARMGQCLGRLYDAQITGNVVAPSLSPTADW
jgi:hypothetical protein